MDGIKGTKIKLKAADKDMNLTFCGIKVFGNQSNLQIQTVNSGAPGIIKTSIVHNWNNYIVNNIR